MMRSKAHQINPGSACPEPSNAVSLIEIDPDTITCPECQGHGALEVHLGFGDIEEHDCSRCLGLGQLPGEEYSFEELCQMSLEEDGDMFIGVLQVTPPEQLPLEFGLPDIPDFFDVA